MQSSSSEAATPARRTSTKATSPSTSQESTGRSYRTSIDSVHRRPALGGQRVSLKWTPDRSPLQSLGRELAALEKQVSTGERLQPAVVRPLNRQEEERLHRSSTLRARVEAPEVAYPKITPKRSRGALLSSSPAFGQPAAAASSSRNSTVNSKQRQSVRRSQDEARIPIPIPENQPVRRLSSRRRKNIAMGLDGNDDIESKIRNQRYNEEGVQLGRLTLRDKDLSGEHRSDSIIHSHPDEARLQDLDPLLFKPPIAIRCGPLLRYKGLRREAVTPGVMGLQANTQMEVWRGSVMCVTVDEESSYTRPPTLRLFSQPVSALQDPRTPSEPPRVFKMKDGESRNKFCTVKATKLHVDRGHTFWRFDLEVELCQEEARIAYKVNHGPTFAFYVPARGQSMNIMFHSCNGFSLSIDPDTFSGTNPLWRDALNNHTKRPFHVMLGGGDQLYNDAVAKQTVLFKEWLNIINPITKHKAPFTPEIADELESFYLNRYCDWFSQGLFGVAIAQIPMVNIWDDHDIIDGFGSYPSHFNRCPVFSGLGNVAYKYYLLFQHQSLVQEEERHEPSWILGNAPGPYIKERSRSVFMFLGRQIAFLGLDCRTERMRGQVVSAETYGIVFDRLRQEIVPGETRHLLVMLGVPIAYPRLVWLENLLTSRIMDPIKFLARIGVIDGFLNTFDGGVEILDDLDDHWTAKNHKQERNAFIEELQELAMEKSVRITILGGDVHLAGIGRFYSNPDLNVHTINDFRYMPNIISSAIVNAPPPNTMADVLNKRNKVHHLNADTDEDMVPIFPVDVDAKPRANKRMMARRNYCTINTYSGEIRNTTEVPPQPKEKRERGIMRLFKKEDTEVKGRAMTERFFVEQADIPLGDALEVNIRVEVDQRDEEGRTRAYQFLVPRLDVEEGIADRDVERREGEVVGSWI